MCSAGVVLTGRHRYGLILVKEVIFRRESIGGKFHAEIAPLTGMHRWVCDPSEAHHRNRRKKR